MTDTEEKLFTRIAVALERLATAVENAQPAASIPQGFAEAVLKMMPGVFSGLFSSMMGGSVVPSDNDAPPAMPNAGHLCKCMHKKENHLQGDGPCLADKCLCHRFDALGRCRGSCVYPVDSPPNTGCMNCGIPSTL